MYKELNKGMPYNSRGEVYGDLIFKFNIIYPDKLNSEDYTKLKNILPNSIFKPNIDNSLQVYKLTPYKKKQNEQQHQPNNCHQQ